MVRGPGVQPVGGGVICHDLPSMVLTPTSCTAEMLSKVSCKRDDGQRELAECVDGDKTS